MTNLEFSNEFDVLYNNISSNQAPGIDEYEKSIFLTKAQEEIVIGLYNGNIAIKSFEGSEDIRRYLNNLVKTVVIAINIGYYIDGQFYGKNEKDQTLIIEGKDGALYLDLNTFKQYKCVIKESDEGDIKTFTLVNDNTISNKSINIELPDNLLFITYEAAKIKSDNKCLNEKEVEVIPITQDTFHRVKNNPFRQANSRRILRLDSGDNTIELVLKDPISSYTVRYLRKPNPIILSNLSNGLTINNQSAASSCELNESIHRVILDKAVRLAIQTFYSPGGPTQQ